MYWRAVVCCVLWCVVVCSGLQCTSPRSSALKLLIRSQRNETGHWIAQVQLGHEAGQKDAGPWEVDVDHTTAKCEDSESVLVAALVTAPPLSPVQQRRPLGAGYELVPGLGFYKFHTEVKTWHEALKICEDEGAHLLVINSETEARAMKLFWDRNPKIVGGEHSTWAWIGFNDEYKEGEFVTVLNTTLASTGYVKWGGGEGSGGTSQNCVLLDRSLILADYRCNAKDPFFCEREL